MHHLYRFVSLLFFLLFVAAASAEDLTYRTTIADAKKGTEQKINVWIPGDVEVVRGMVVNPFYDKLAEREDYQAFARTIGFGLMGGGLDRKGDMPAAVTQALTEAAAELDRPELAHVPLAFGGFSAGGGMAVKLATLMPDRTLCAWSVGNPGTGFAKEDPGLTRDADILRSIPILTMNGSVDPFVDHHQGNYKAWIEAHYTKIQSLGLPWTVAIQWGKGHDYGNANALAWPFIAEVMRARLPEEGWDPTKGPAELRAVSASMEGSMFGDLFTIDTASPTWQTAEASEGAWGEGEAEGWDGKTWLLNGRVAAIWSSFCSRDPGFKVVVEAAGENDVSLRLEGELPEGVTAVTFHDGEVMIDEVPDASQQPVVAIDKLSPVAAIYAVAWVGEEKRAVSNPVSWVRNTPSDGE